MNDQERIAGGLLGLLIGDALGVPYEFHEPDEIPPFELIEYDPPSGFERAHSGTPHGTWSDDGAQALCLLASLLNANGFDPEDFGERLVLWRDEGYMAVDGRVFDVGITTNSALQALRQGTPALQAGPSGEDENGNGALMRVLPLALWHRGPDEELVHLAHQQSLVTHGHMRSQVCCALYCLWARYTLEGQETAWHQAVSSLKELYGNHPEARYELEEKVLPFSHLEGTGYVVDCLKSARWATEQGDYEAVLKAAISLGRDTDTTACVAGGIAGLRDGLEAIPQRWREGLKGWEIVEPLLERLIKSRES